MVVAAKSNAQTNHRMFVLWGAEVVNPRSGNLAVFVDIGYKLRQPSHGSRAGRPYIKSGELEIR